MGSKKNIKKSKQINISVNPSASKTNHPADGHPSEIHPKVKTILILSAILLLAVTVYFNSIGNGFIVLDDDVNVYDNVFIRELSAANLKVYFTKPLLAMYTPLVYISYAIDYRIGGLDPRIYHATNLLLHLLNITILFFLVRLLTQRIEISAIVALLFAVHPLNVGAVAPVSTRGTLLYAFFFLAAFLCYIRYLKDNFRLRYLVLTLVLFLMALLSKSAAVVLPLALFLSDYYYKREFDARAIAEKIPFFVLSLIFGILTFAFREDAGHIGSLYVFSVFDRIFLVGYSVVFYIFKVLIPIKLSAFYPYPVKIDGFLPLWFYPTPLVVAGLVLLIYKLQNYRKELVFGSLFFLTNIILVLKIVPMGEEMVCDRYAYLPYIGFFLIIGWAYCWIADRFYNSSKGWIKYCIITAIVVPSIVFSAVSSERIKVWKDSLTLFNDVLEKDPFVYLAYNNRGTLKSNQKDFSGAIDDFNKGIELNPGRPNAYNGRGVAMMGWGKDHAGAMADFSKAIELNPRYAEAYNNRGHLKNSQKDFPGAIDDFNRAIELNPGHAGAYNGRGVAKIEWIKDYAGAMADYSKAIELNPGLASAYKNRGNLKSNQKDFPGAIDDFNKAIELNPGIASAYNGRGVARIEWRKDYTGAMADFSKAIELNPGYAEAYYNYDATKTLLGRMDAARQPH